MKFKMFKSVDKTWREMAKEAAAFAATIPADRLVSISHACDSAGEGTIIVWYRTTFKTVVPSAFDTIPAVS